MRHPALSAALLLMSSGLGATGLDDETLQRWHSSLTQLAESAAACVTRSDTGHDVFDGCIDWHSSVHGHWALLRAGRLLQRPEFIDIAKHSLRPSALSEELELLRERPRFEMPYGRAWLLLLVVEFETQFPTDKRLVMIGDLAAKSLESYLAGHRCRAVEPEYANESWAYLRLLEYWRHRRAEERWVAVSQRAAQCAEGRIDFSFDRRSRAFFSPIANLIQLQAERLDLQHFTDWFDRLTIDWDALTPVDQPESAHHLSINYARAWGLWTAWRQAGERRALTAFIQHADANLSWHARWRNDYFSYGHWVPQFGIYALSGPLADFTSASIER